MRFYIAFIFCIPPVHCSTKYKGKFYPIEHQYCITLLETSWSWHRAVHAGGQDTLHAEVEEEQVRPVDGGQLLHLVTLELIHEGGDGLSAGSASGGVHPGLLIPQDPAEAGADHHGPQLPRAVQVHNVGEVTQTRGAVVSHQGPVRILTSDDIRQCETSWPQYFLLLETGLTESAALPFSSNDSSSIYFYCEEV